MATIRELQQQLDLREPAPTGGPNTIERREPSDPVAAQAISYIINPSANREHTGGNEKLRLAGRTFTGGNVAGDIADATKGAGSWRTRASSSECRSPMPGEPGIGPDLAAHRYVLTDGMKLSHFFDGEGIQLIHQSSAHSDGDSLVWFPRPT